MATSAPTGIHALQRTLDQIFARPRGARQTVAMVEEKRLDKNALAKAKRLAAKHGIEIERAEDAGEFWVNCHRFDDGEDPMEGNHFCCGGREVLQAVEDYVGHLGGVL